MLENFINSFKTNILKKILILAAIIAFFFYVLNYLEKRPNSLEIHINDNKIFAQVADSENERSMGLSFTKSLDENAGMLFIFDDVSVKNFWMRDMLFDLDIVWLDESKKVIGFFENVKKESYNYKYPELSRIYKSPENTKFVLEIPAGSIKKFLIKTGDVLEFKY